MVDLDQILDLLSENTRKTGLPVPIPPDEIYKWAEPLSLSREGDVYLFTGALYQLVPYIESLIGYLESMEERGARSRFMMRASRILSAIPKLSKLALRPSKESVENSRRILRSIARLLKSSGVEYAYLYEDDMYSGILLYDMGLEEDFSSHANKVYGRLKARGARKVITVDPHTTHALRDVYPKYIDGYDLEVVNYLELLSGYLGEVAGEQESKGSVVIHDPCYYARFDNIIEQPRNLLRLAGYTPVDPRRSRELTYCCGGPIEALSPRLSARIARTRLEELSSKGSLVVTLCPICYSNLSRVKGDGVEVRDIALLLTGLAGEP